MKPNDRPVSDHLDEFAESPLLRALRAPGTPEELGSEDAVRHAFRAAHGLSPRPRASSGVVGMGARLVGRIGLGGVAIVTTVALTGGVAAAAYQQALPHPVQTLAHEAFGRIGVPRAPTPEAPRPTKTLPAPTAEPPSAGPRTPTPDVDRSPKPPMGSASEPTSSTPSPEPSESRSADGVPEPDMMTPSATAASVRATLSGHRVDANGTITVGGLVRDADGGPVMGQQVWLLQRRTTGAWTQVSSAITNAGGRVTLTSEPLPENTFVRLSLTVPAPAPAPVPDSDDTASTGATSAPTASDNDRSTVLLTRARRVTVRPVVEVRLVGQRLLIHVQGAQHRDAVLIHRAVNKRFVHLGTQQLDGAGDTSHDLSDLGGRVRIAVQVVRTKTHAASRKVVRVRLPKTSAPGPTPTPTPTPSHEPTPAAIGPQGPGTLSGESAAPADTSGSSTTTGS